MFDYSQELRRRINQFTIYLKKMLPRSHDEVCGSCFMIFDEDPPSGQSGSSELAESVIPSLELAVAAFDEAGIASITVNDETPFLELPIEGWKENNSQKRFIQFSFEKDWFCMDIPFRNLCHGFG